MEEKRKEGREREMTQDFKHLGELNRLLTSDIPIDMWGQITLCCGGCPNCCRMVGSNPRTLP